MPRVGDRVKEWRFDQLRRCGYSPEGAMVIAECTDVDLHKAEMLLRAGCSEITALGILL